METEQLLRDPDIEPSDELFADGLGDVFGSYKAFVVGLVERGIEVEELWQLFPIRLEKYNPAWVEWYEAEAAALLDLLGDKVVGIEHIGSTSVRGLTAKPIVDILLQVSPTCDLAVLKTLLSDAGWLLMAERTAPDRRSDWNKGYTPDGFAEKVFHLHIREVGDRDEPYFRDYLSAHPQAAYEYEALKRELAVKYEHDRDAYTEAKGEFVRACTTRARLTLRLERAQDRRAVEEVTLAAFETFKAEGVPKLQQVRLRAREPFRLNAARRFGTRRLHGTGAGTGSSRSGGWRMEVLRGLRSRRGRGGFRGLSSHVCGRASGLCG
ncbi:MAG TPA: hypothetical protein DEB24_08270 [Coriobacteriia bacterium]|nr:hypothetical protein [Coriobacteriia bacterium]